MRVMIMGTHCPKGSGSAWAGAARDPYFNTHLPPLSDLIFLRFTLNKLGTEGIGKMLQLLALALSRSHIRSRTHRPMDVSVGQYFSWRYATINDINILPKKIHNQLDNATSLSHAITSCAGSKIRIFRAREGLIFDYSFSVKHFLLHHHSTSNVELTSFWDNVNWFLTHGFTLSEFYPLTMDGIGTVKFPGINEVKGITLRTIIELIERDGPIIACLPPDYEDPINNPFCDHDAQTCVLAQTKYDNWRHGREYHAVVLTRFKYSDNESESYFQYLNSHVEEW